MAGSIGDRYRVGRSSGVISTVQPCRSTGSLADWRSVDQLENNTPSTSPSYWDTDDEEEQFGLKPSELYGMFTWNIENFSSINKRELRSNVFEVGGYKWYILIYPQGCDVCNHLSLFLCVADHDKLLPGWSHFAQFTISVVNKEPKKSKYSDTLHKFWKKEHDWGWKKFMEISKVLDGFICDGTLVIKAQVQVIREKADRPFRCLDCLYRRELVRVYLTNVEQICRRFVEERRDKLVKLIGDKARWESFCEFWEKVDAKIKVNMCREKSDAILKVVVKHFFIEKEVTSTLVMDSLYSGLKVLECQNNGKEGKTLDTEETPAPIVRLENDMFVLVGDMLQLLKRAALQPLPPKDEKGPQNRTKDGNSGEDYNKDSIEHDERRLTELGRRTVEIFVLAHIFSTKIEVKHQEAVALKKQEELIREEEEEADFEQKGKRAATEKEKQSKKKQSKHKKSNRKGKDKGKERKDKGKEEKLNITVQVVTPTDPIEPPVESIPDKPDSLDVLSDVSDNVSENLQLESEDRDSGTTTNWDTDTSEVLLIDLPLQGQEERKSTTMMDDSSSTCSMDSVVLDKDQTSPTRENNQVGEEIEDRDCEFDSQPCNPVVEAVCQYDTAAQSYKATDGGGDTDAVLSLKDQIKLLQQHLVEKEEEVVTLQKKLDVKDQVDFERPSEGSLELEATPLVSGTTPRNVVGDRVTPVESVQLQEIQTRPHQNSWKATTQVGTLGPKTSMISKRENVQHHQVAVAPPSSRVVSTVQITPPPPPPPPPSSSSPPPPFPQQNYVPHSHRTATTGENMVIGGGFNHTPPPPPPSSSQPTTSYMVSPPQVRSGFSFGSVSQGVLQGQPPWTADNHHATTTGSHAQYGTGISSSSTEDFPHLDIINYLLDEENTIHSRDSSRYDQLSSVGGYRHEAYGFGSPIELLPQDSGYGNGQVLGAGYQNQWLLSHQMSTMLNMTTEGEVYRQRYQLLPEYANITPTAVNGGGSYNNMYYPSNGLGN